MTNTKHLKLIAYVTTILLLASCAPKSLEKIEVVYNEVAGQELLQSEIFSSVEVVQLTGDNDLLFGGMRGVFKIYDDKIYLLDNFATQKIFVFNLNGEHLQTIGSIGKGPEEYMHPKCFWVDDDGNVTIFSESIGKSVTYNGSGDFIKSVDHPDASQAIALDGYLYDYLDHGRGFDYRLQVSNEAGDSLASYLPSANVINFGISSPFFSSYGDVAYLCEPYGSDIFSLKEGKLDTLYCFNFGKYGYPEEFFDYSYSQSMQYLMENPFLVKAMFMEDSRNTVFSASITSMADQSEKMLYGVKTSDKNWHWFLLPSGDPMAQEALKYVHKGYAYFLADPVSLKEKFPDLKINGLDNLKDDENVILLKCKLK